MTRHNNAIQKIHLRKHYHRFIRTWFNQAGKKATRQRIRKEKAAACFPRPADRLRPVVRCQTQRYNSRSKLGKGFSLEEIKAAGLNLHFAQSIGISVDHRRRNKCQESIEVNKKRLQAYLNKLVLFPRQQNKAHEKAKPVADTSNEVLKGFAPAQVELTAVFPATQDKLREKVLPLSKVSALNKNVKEGAYRKLRVERTNQKWAGIREKKAKEAADKEK